MENLTNDQKLTINNIVNKFRTFKGNQFVGIKGYTSKKGETSNNVVNCGFKYENAVNKDIERLRAIKNVDINTLAIESKFAPELITQAIEKMLASFVKNQNKDTQSAGSIAQQNAYVKIANSVKMNIETGMIYIYALNVSKTVIVKGEYPIVNSRPLTLAQNAVKKFFELSTAKFRNYIINPEILSQINMKGENYTF